MRRTMVNVAAVAVLFMVSAAVGLAQVPLPPVSKGKAATALIALRLADTQIDELVAEALRNNPDVRVAQAKLMEAQAQLDRVRLEVTRKVVAQKNAIARQREVISRQETFLPGFFGNDRVRALNDLKDAKANLAEMEAELPYMLGRSSPTSAQRSNVSTASKPVFVLDVASGQPGAGTLLLDGKRIIGGFGTLDQEGRLIGGMAVTEAIPVSMGDKIRTALDKRVTMKYKQKKLSEVLDDFRKEMPEVTILTPEGFKWDYPIDLQVENMSLGTIFQLIQDQVLGLPLRFVIRDYGILATSKEYLPEGAVFLNDFWKNKPAAKPAAEKPATTKPATP